MIFYIIDLSNYVFDLIAIIRYFIDYVRQLKVVKKLFRSTKRQGLKNLIIRLLLVTQSVIDPCSGLTD